MIRLHILSGARAGAVCTPTHHMITIGRHPEADLPFDVQGDPLVSVQHAVIWNDGQRYFLRDLESRNGTFLNGARVPPGDTPLADGDRIAFGSDAALVEVRILDPAAGAAAETASPTQRIRAAVRHQTRWLRRTLIVCGVALVSGTALVLYARQSQRQSWDRERTRLEQRIDSIAEVGEENRRALEDELRELNQALAHARDEVQHLTAALDKARSRGDDARTAQLQRQLQAATLALEQHQLAATLDFRAIEQANRRAVARIYVEAPDGTVSTGTAFAVRPDGTLLTNRHVVAGSTGTAPARRLAIQFAASDQVWPARLVALSEEADLAVVKVDNILGAVPTIRSFNLRADTVARGAPVATIGFPLGGGVSAGGGDGAARLARPLVFAGLVSRVSPGRLEFLGYGAVGASGSPVFDANGEVVAILYAGRKEEAGHVSLAVPAVAAVDLLAKVR